MFIILSPKVKCVNDNSKSSGDTNNIYQNFDEDK